MPVTRLLLRQFTSPAILILLVTAIIYGALGNEHDALVLLAIIIPSGLLTFVQEYRAEGIIRKLASRLATVATVIRDQVERELPIDQLVEGDLIHLVPGAVVPADLILLSGTNLMIDESVLTGESIPRHKSPEDDRELFMGTHVSSGSGRARVVAIGDDTRYGAMVSKIESAEVMTSFERGVRDFGILVARAILFLVAFVFSGNLVLQRPLFESLLFSLALAVGLTPQMLPVIISVCLSSGARQLATEKVLVKRLDAIEDLGTMELLCTDKTGTLTEGELHVERALDGEGKDSPAVLELAYVNARLQGSSANAIDRAILQAISLATLPECRGEIDFTFKRRRVSILTSDGRLICKGAFRELMEISNRIRVRSQIVQLDSQRSELSERYEKLITEGYKVIAVASRAIPETLIESELVFEGFILITDPAKIDARESISGLSTLGIVVNLVSGDSVASSLQIASEVGIDCSSVIRGSEIEQSTNEVLKSCRVFAEVDPIQKSLLVERLRSLGLVVGFLGDGINDAPALRAADVAISVDDAMDVAKSASSIVLLEKNLSVIADGVRIGRRTFENTMKYVRITMSASFGNVLSMAIASFFLPFLPMLPTQILLLNFLSDLPALAISSDRVDDEDLAGARHWTMRGIGHFMVLFGMISTAFDLMLFFMVISLFEGSEREIRSSWFALSLITEVIAILVLRTRRRSWQSPPSKTLGALALLAVLIALSVPYLGLLQPVELPRIGAEYSALVISIALGYLATSEFAKLRSRLVG